MKTTFKVPLKGKRLTLGHKLMLTDVLPFDKHFRTIAEIIRKSPIYLWKIIHKKHSNVSLTRDAYATLKIAVEKKNASLVDKANKEHDQSKSQRVANKEFRDGGLGNKESRFRLINKTKIIKY